MKALRSVSSLLLRKMLMSWAYAVMVSTSSSTSLRCESMALASCADASSFSCRSLWSLMRGLKSSMSRSVVSARS